MTYLAKVEDVEDSEMRGTQEAFEGLCTTRYYSVRYFSAFGKYFCSLGGGSVATGSAQAKRAAEPSCHFGRMGRLTCEWLLSGS